ncbi:54S ribosomal protein L8, mitochondrial [Mycoemilia scoparia]|uniref:Large ribosomal subunit protein bL17c n=1 Tax=Mycoemilia scoparia TaxID=417184 RepID=A0A9W8A2L8_9FUNG|nr:54S ribosomal protein L8, mitochondrial [Mycoemilia scoparia]
MDYRQKMYHGKHMRRLNRTSSHRRALLRNLTSALIKHERIETTLPKAKELRRMVDKMITLGKRGDHHARNQVLAYVFEPRITVPKLFGPLAERYAQRPGGFTRIIRSGFRKGDNAPKAIIELVNPQEPSKELGSSLLIRDLAYQQVKAGEKIVEPTIKAEEVAQSAEGSNNNNSDTKQPSRPLDKREWKKLLDQKDARNKRARILNKYLSQSGFTAEQVQSLVDTDAQHLEAILQRRKDLKLIRYMKKIWPDKPLPDFVQR